MPDHSWLGSRRTVHEILDGQLAEQVNYPVTACSSFLDDLALAVPMTAARQPREKAESLKTA